MQICGTFEFCRATIFSKFDDWSINWLPRVIAQDIHIFAVHEGLVLGFHFLLQIMRCLEIWHHRFELDFLRCNLGILLQFVVEGATCIDVNGEFAPFEIGNLFV